MYSPQEVQDICMICRKYSFFIISDEIYSELAHQNHVSFYKYYPEGTFVTGGLSKAHGGGGYRIGFLVLPKGLDLMHYFVKVASETYSCVSTLGQFAAVKAFSLDSSVDKSINDIADIMRIIISSFCEKLNHIGIQTTTHDGGFYVTAKLNLPQFKTSGELALMLLEQYNLGTLPGTAFGIPENELVLRLAIVDFDGEDVLIRYKNGEDILKFIPQLDEAIEIFKVVLK